MGKFNPSSIKQTMALLAGVWLNLAPTTAKIEYLPVYGVNDP
jgi:hypothetical protein